MIPVFAAPVIKEADYKGRGVVEVEFRSRVNYSSTAFKVTIKYGSKNYAKKVLEKGTDDLDVRVAGLKKGRKYTYTISGVRRQGGSAYYTVTGTFTA